MGGVPGCEARGRRGRNEADEDSPSARGQRHQGLGRLPVDQDLMVPGLESELEPGIPNPSARWAVFAPGARSSLLPGGEVGWALSHGT